MKNNREAHSAAKITRQPLKNENLSGKKHKTTETKNVDIILET